jgi:hypothetical protein
MVDNFFVKKKSSDLPFHYKSMLSYVAISRSAWMKRIVFQDISSTSRNRTSTRILVNIGI